MKQLKYLPVVLVLLLVVGCAGVKTMTADDYYYEALGIWYSLTETFEYQYNKATPEQRSVWGKEFAPMLLQAKELLDLWDIRRNSKQPTLSQMEDWKKMRNDLLYYFAEKIDKRGG